MKTNKWGTKYLKPLVIVGVLAGLLLTLLIYTSHRILHKTIEASETSSILTNVSGRQRMLSQRIPLLSLQLVNSRNSVEKKVLREKLLDALNSMKKRHDELIDKGADLNQEYRLTPQLRRIYFSAPYYLNSKVLNFISEALALANVPDKVLSNNNPHLLKLINANNEELLDAFEAATSQYNKEHLASMYGHEDMEDLSTSVSISILIGMALFIFWPLVRHLKAETVALAESEELYRTFSENFQGIAFKSRIDFVPLFFHGAVEEITGYTESDFLSGNPRWDEVIHPQDLPAFLDLAEKLSSVKAYSIKHQYRIIHKDGEVRWVNEVVQNVCDSSGKINMVQGYIYDMTEKKQMYELRDKTVEEFERFNRLALGREKRMVELKSEVNDLLQLMGKEGKYRIHNHEEPAD